MRDAKLAIATALRSDTAVTERVPAWQIFAVERATLPTLPSIEVIGVSSERVDTGPLVRHSMAVEVTVSHPTEDGADELLDGIVTAVRRRLLDAERSDAPISTRDPRGRSGRAEGRTVECERQRDGGRHQGRERGARCGGGGVTTGVPPGPASRPGTVGVGDCAGESDFFFDDEIVTVSGFFVTDNVTDNVTRRRHG